VLVSFAAHGVTEVVRELELAAGRGVRVDLVLEDTLDRGGALRVGAGSGAFDLLAGRVNVWHWPPANRGAGGRAALHAKLVVADGRSVLLSSANFTTEGFRTTSRSDSWCTTRTSPGSSTPISGTSCGPSPIA